MAWNQPNTRKEVTSSRLSRTGRSGLARGITAALVVVIGIGTALFLLTGRKADEKPAAQREIGKVPPPKAKTGGKAQTRTTVPSAPAEMKARAKTDDITVVESHVTTNATGAIIEKQVLSNGRRITKVRPPEPIFTNSADQLIAMSLSVKPGQAMAPLPDLANVDEDFMKSLENPLRVEETDSDEVKMLKGRVMEARAYLREEVRGGKTVREALKAYRAEMEKYSDSHLMAVKSIQKFRESEGEEMARAFRERINESFRIQGIPELEAIDQKTSPRRKAK